MLSLYMIAAMADTCYTQRAEFDIIIHMFNDFKAFIMRGNVLDLAVGVIIGGAFGKIVSSVVTDLLMPLVSVISGGANFSSLKTKIGGTATEPVYLTYGAFIQAAIDFIIIAICVFLVVKVVSKMKKPVPATPAHLTKDQELLIEIRDALKK